MGFPAVWTAFYWNLWFSIDTSMIRCLHKQNARCLRADASGRCPKRQQALDTESLQIQLGGYERVSSGGTWSAYSRVTRDSKQHFEVRLNTNAWSSAVNTYSFRAVKVNTSPCSAVKVNTSSCAAVQVNVSSCSGFAQRAGSIRQHSGRSSLTSQHAEWSRSMNHHAQCTIVSVNTSPCSADTVNTSSGSALKVNT